MTRPSTRIAAFVAALLIATAGAGQSVAGPAPHDSAGTSSGAPRAAPLGGGELIAFERTVPGQEGRDLYATSPDGGEPQLVRSPGEYAHWSPDGSTLAFLACLNPPDCTTAVALLDRGTGDVHWFPFPDPDLESPCPVWEPSGDRLACGALSEVDPTRNGVYTIRASDGQGLTRITTNPGGEDSPLAYSPDGSRLLFARFDPSRGRSANQALFVTAVAGGQPQRITPWGFADDWAGWSPDGRTIVFGTNGSLFRVSPQGHGLARIRLTTPDPASARTAFDVSFSPDGRRIVFSLVDPPGIYTARLDGSDVRRLTTSPTDDHHASWGSAPGS